MSNKQLNPGLLSAIRGGEVIAFSFRVNGTSNPDGLVQGRANAIDSVTYEDVGKTFTVTFNDPRPRQIIAAIVDYQTVTASTVLHKPYVKLDSYVPGSAATFVIENVTDANGDGAYAVSVLPDNTIVSVVLFCQTVDQLVEDDG